MCRDGEAARDRIHRVRPTHADVTIVVELPCALDPGPRTTGIGDLPARQEIEVERRSPRTGTEQQDHQERTPYVAGSCGRDICIAFDLADQVGEFVPALEAPCRGERHL